MESDHSNRSRVVHGGNDQGERAFVRRPQDVGDGNVRVTGAEVKKGESETVKGKRPLTLNVTFVSIMGN